MGATVRKPTNQNDVSLINKIVLILPAYLYEISKLDRIELFYQSNNQ
jgi:hypothetical protein